MKQVFDAVVEACGRREAHAWLKVGRTRLAVRSWPGMIAGQRTRVSLRPEDVILCLGHPGTTSARNVLPGHVRKTRHISGGMRVELDAGFPLSAVVTREAAKELGLRSGMGIFALIKASSITVVQEVEAGFRVAFIGSRGVLDHQKIDLMKAVASEGSLTAAARTMGMSYRTAWIWVQEINRCWGRALMTKAHGGKGGGGASLTPEGIGLLQQAERLESGEI
ncbi:MAG: TOBE domain-containing protein [Planctomycetota bacterium]